MSIRSSQGSTFSFCGTTYTVTSVTVDGPTPEVVDMTSTTDGASVMRMVPTGAYTSPGRISVEGFGFSDPESLIGEVGSASFVTPLGTITKNAVCDSATVDAKVGDVLRVRFTLTPTDYQP